MTPLVLDRRQLQEVDRRAVADYGFQSLVLMENAGRGVADRLEPLLAGDGRPTVICCGRGNNGGDGLVIARHLDLRGHAVEVLLMAQPDALSPDAAANFRIAERGGLAVSILGRDFSIVDFPSRLARAGWIVDALLGTGSRGVPRTDVAGWIDAINAASRPVLAVDLPSGLDCDGVVVSPHTICAALTCTFVALKPGLFHTAAAPYTGEITVHDIGVPMKLVQKIANE